MLLVALLTTQYCFSHPTPLYFSPHFPLSCSLLPPPLSLPSPSSPTLPPPPPLLLSLGRLYQVEYAMEAIGHAGTCLGVLASDGVLLAAERKNTNKLLDEAILSEKIYKLDE